MQADGWEGNLILISSYQELYISSRNHEKTLTEFPLWFWILLEYWSYLNQAKRQYRGSCKLL